MKKEDSFGANYVRLGGILYLHYMYVDLNVEKDYVADSLFARRQLPVKFGDEMCRDGDKYRAIFCKVNRKHQKAFEEALDEIRNKMSLLGHNDYEDYCAGLFKKLADAK